MKKVPIRKLFSTYQIKQNVLTRDPKPSCICSLFKLKPKSMMLPNNSPSLFHYLQNVSISLKDKFRRLDEVSICDNDLIYCEDLNTQQITYDRNTNILGYSKKKLTCNLLENQIHKRHKLFHTITRRLITRDQLINLSYNVYCKLRYWAYDKKRTLIEICEQTYPILTDTEKLPYLFVHFCKIHQVSHPFGCSSMDVGIYEPSGQLSPVHRPFKWQLYTIQEKIIKGECGFMNKHTFLSERGRQCMALVANGLNQKEKQQRNGCNHHWLRFISPFNSTIIQ